MYTILSTNAQDVKQKGLDAKTKTIDVAVLDSDIEQANPNPTFYAYRYGMYYNPNNDFKPNIEPNHRIKGELVEFYFNQLEHAREQYKKKLDERQASGSANPTQSIEIKNMRERIKEQAKKIEELSANKPSAGTSQAERLEALIEMQAEAIKQVNSMRPREIVIKINEKENKLETDVVHEEFETVLGYIADDEPVFLAGPAGTGKSHIAEQVAKALGLDFYPCSALSQEYKATGFIDANGTFHETQFYKAFKNGGLFMIDEIDASHPDVLVILNTAIEQRYFDFPNGKIDAHPDFRIISAGNTVGTGADMQYTGRNQLDASTLDRFYIIDINYCREIEMSISNNDAELVEFAQKIRKTAIDLGITLLFSYRSIGRIAKQSDKMDLVKLLKHALLKGMASDDVQILARNAYFDSTNKYYEALKKAV